MLKLNESLKESDFGYAAGFLDGEGCIFIARSISKDNRYDKHKEYLRHQLRISVSQNKKAPIEWLMQKFGGCCSFKTGKRSYDNGRYERWDWVIGNKAASDFLLLVRPYLIVKALEADIAIEFQKTVNYHTGRNKLSDEIMHFRETCYKNLKLAKRA